MTTFITQEWPIKDTDDRIKSIKYKPIGTVY